MKNSSDLHNHLRENEIKKFMGEEEGHDDIYGNLASKAETDYNTNMSGVNTITPKWVLGAGGTAFVLLLSAFGGGYIALDNKIDKNTHAISILSERTARVETRLDNIEDKLVGIERRFDKIDIRFDRLDEKLDQLLQKK